MRLLMGKKLKYFFWKLRQLPGESLVNSINRGTSRLVPWFACKIFAVSIFFLSRVTPHQRHGTQSSTMALTTAT